MGVTNYMFIPQGILSGKDAELAEYQEKVEKLQGQLKAVEQHSSRATLVNMKKV